MGLFFRRRTNGVPKRPFNLTQFLIMTVLAIVLLQIFTGIMSIWFEEFAQVAQQISMGVLLLVIMAAVVMAFMLVRRAGGSLSTQELVLIMLTIGFVIFLMIVVPNIFNLPKAFSAAHLELQSIFRP